MSREQARQRLFHDDRYRRATEYGFPIEWYQRIREDFPEFEVAYDMATHRMLLIALRSSGLPQVWAECESAFDACRMHSMLCEGRAAADADALKDFIVADRTERERVRQNSIDKGVDALDPTRMADNYRRATGVKGAQVLVP